MTSPSDSAPVVRVRGEVTRRFAPDHAVLSLVVQQRSVTDSAAALQQASATGAALREALDGVAGVREVVLSRVSVHEATEWNSRTQAQERTGWVAYLGGHVTTDAALAGDVAGLVTVTGAGLSGVGWGLDDPAAARRETRIAAVAAAREAAEDFAGAVGRALGELRVLADSGLSGGVLTEASFSTDRAASTAVVAPQPELDPEPVEMHVAVEATYLLRVEATS